MRLYWELASLSFKRQITYRTATLAGLATNFYFGMLRAAVLVALFGAQQQIGGLSVQDAVTYTGLTQAIIAFLSLFGWYDLMNSIHTGDIASDLLKPVSSFSFWMARDLGRAGAQLLLRGIPILLIYAIFFDLSFPHGIGRWLWLAAAILLAWLVSFVWRFLVNLAGFWVPNAAGLGRVAFTLTWFLSGFIMPLRLMPDWFARLCYLTPFPSMVNAIVEIYLGGLDQAGVLRVFLQQLIWIAILGIACRQVLRAGFKRLVLQGG